MYKMEDAALEKIISCFPFEEEVKECVLFGKGHIHSTYMVTLLSGKKYILQKINDHIFQRVPELMNNIRLVTEYIREKTGDPKKSLSLILTKEGHSMLSDESGYWRVYEYIDNSISLEQVESDKEFYLAGYAFGEFEELLKDFPVEKIVETIPDFHNTPKRYQAFHEVCEKDPAGRKKEVEKEIQFLLERETEMGILQSMYEEGTLPVRVTHNDTKLNNVLFDRDTRNPVCVVDLDTVMPGLSLYDFGDAIRFGASTANEDEKDLSKVEMDLNLYRAFSEGFAKACPNLTDEEIRLLPVGAKVMTLECGLRFLTDYLDGDHYFSIEYPQHNLDRCRTQLKLTADMESKWDEMNRIARSLR